MSTELATQTRTRALRELHLIRAGFSVVWAVVFALTVSATYAADSVTVAGALLLVAYPVWDVIATVLDLAWTPRDQRPTFQNANVVISSLTAVAVLISLVQGRVTGGILVIGIWAIMTGAVQLVLAINRRRLGGQWPLMISGTQSAAAGVTIALASTSDRAAATLTGYALFGAVYFILAAVFETRRIRKSAGRAA